MRVVTADEIDDLLTFPDLIAALAEAFRADIAVPVRPACRASMAPIC